LKVFHAGADLILPLLQPSRILIAQLSQMIFFVFFDKSHQQEKEKREVQFHYMALCFLHTKKITNLVLIAPIPSNLLEPGNFSNPPFVSVPAFNSHRASFHLPPPCVIESQT
jgi:hypothetical protein